MNSKIKSHVGLILISLAAIGTELVGEAPTEATDTTVGVESTEPKRRGRPPHKASEEKPAEPEKDDAARFEANRALIKPLVDASQGEDVKKVIAKYSKTGLKDVPAASQADFEKDIAALGY